MTLDQIQEEIVEEFAAMNGDYEQIMSHLVCLGRILPEMPAKYRSDINLIKGCHSKVWIAVVPDINKIHLYADSDTLISKGLISLLFRVFNGRDRDDILNSSLYFFRRNHLERFIGTTRTNGFHSMIDHIKLATGTAVTTIGLSL
jgi:cysteine desulfuration protein SufE